MVERQRAGSGTRQQGKRGVNVRLVRYMYNVYVYTEPRTCGQWRVRARVLTDFNYGIWCRWNAQFSRRHMSPLPPFALFFHVPFPRSPPRYIRPHGSLQFQFRAISLPFSPFSSPFPLSPLSLLFWPVSLFNIDFLSKGRKYRARVSSYARTRDCQTLLFALRFGIWRQYRGRGICVRCLSSCTVLFV